MRAGGSAFDAIGHRFFGQRAGFARRVGFYHDTHAGVQGPGDAAEHAERVAFVAWMPFSVQGVSLNRMRRYSI